MIFILTLITIGINNFNINAEPALNSYAKDTGEFKEGENINNELTRWFINTETNECETFQYRGTKGNFNNFRTKIECKRHFENPVSDKIEGCQDTPKSEGNCNTLKKDELKEDKWSWNPANGECENFKYSGCGGNRNRYDSQNECEAFCYNEEEHYGKPTGTSLTLDAEKKAQYIIPNYHDCHLKPDLQTETVEIKAIALIDTRQCVYAAAGSSVKGKKIRGAFDNINECIKKCFQTDKIKKMQQKIPACSRVQPDQYEKPTEGAPKPEIRFYYDHSDKGCTRFESWPGKFNPTKNNFPSAEICESYCGWGKIETLVKFNVNEIEKPTETNPIEREPVCFLPKAGEFSESDNINGNLKVKRWYFDSSEENFKCRSFLFGGLNGNSNNFKSKDACKNICWTNMDVDENAFNAEDANSTIEDDQSSS